jgi:hypothetical protein
MTKVFITNDSGHDYSAAKQFGELIPLSAGTVNKFHITKMLRQFEPLLRDSSPHDFILQSGPSIMNCIACAYFAALHGRLNLLIFRLEENGAQRYVVRRLSFRKGEREG